MSLLLQFVSWPMFGIALLVFGFAPGVLLRLIVLALPKDDPRRHELLGELYAVPRFERPFWVVEQLEVALVEGLGGRLVWAATGRIIHRWHLSSGVRRNREHPDTFYIPPEEERRAVAPGMDVKLMFEMRDGWGERMWVKVVAVKKRKLVGMLDNFPVGIPRLLPGDKIKFKPEHIIDISYDDDHSELVEAEELPGLSGAQLVHDGCNCRCGARTELETEHDRPDSAPSPPSTSQVLGSE